MKKQTLCQTYRIIIIGKLISFLCLVHFLPLRSFVFKTVRIQGRASAVSIQRLTSRRCSPFGKKTVHRCGLSSEGPSPLSANAQPVGPPTPASRCPALTAVRHSRQMGVGGGERSPGCAHTVREVLSLVSPRPGDVPQHRHHTAGSNRGLERGGVRGPRGVLD